ncbi:MAG TPA: hypothetical protein PLN40_11780, partial [Agitococcus sp.]|nr:hypothetical protein [Agitococcus sp.]
THLPSGAINLRPVAKNATSRGERMSARTNQAIRPTINPKNFSLAIVIGHLSDDVSPHWGD